MDKDFILSEIQRCAAEVVASRQAREGSDDTVAMLVAAAAEGTNADAARIDSARRSLADCDARLAKYRAALDNGRSDDNAL
jgi:hypothetical protein